MDIFKKKITMRRSRRARYMRLTVRPDGTVLAIRPWWVSRTSLERFIFEKRLWIERAIARIRSRVGTVHGAQDHDSRAHYLAYRDRAHAFVNERAQYFALLMGVTYARITVRNQSSRWGSCSRSGNLSFNYRLLFLPPELADYVIVHELCHLIEFNHSPRFWKLVSIHSPYYMDARKRIRMVLLGSLPPYEF